jgi:putative transposase
MPYTLCMQESIFFHVYNRGADRRSIFNSETDIQYFYSLFYRYLTNNQLRNSNGRSFPNYHNKVRIHAFCLMTDHFHFALEELEEGAIGKFMQSLKSAYCRYFNQKYSRTGVLFETKYQRRFITSSEDLFSLSRYVHLNALAMQKDYWKYHHSSFQYYLNNTGPDWLYTRTISSLMDSPMVYLAFHEEYRNDLAIKALAAIQV